MMNTNWISDNVVYKLNALRCWAGTHYAGEELREELEFINELYGVEAERYYHTIFKTHRVLRGEALKGALHRIIPA